MQMAYRDHLLPAIEQRVGNAHVQRWVGNAVLARDNHQHALARFKARQKPLALFFGFAREFLHREAARQHRLRAFLGRKAQIGTHTQKSRGQRLLTKVHVHQRADKPNTASPEVERIGNQAWRHLHVWTGIVMAHLALDVANGVHRGHEHIIDARVHQLRHVAVYQLHRITRLALRIFLRALHRVVVGCI